MELLKKIFGIIKKNIFLSIMSLFVLIGGIIIMVVMFKFFISDSNAYDERLDGIKEVEISKKDISKIESKIEENETVASASVRVQGKIIYINLKFNDGVNLDTAKGVATSTLENFSEEELNFYDLGYFLINENESSKFSVTGSKKAKRESISYIKS